ncbi:GNAT family N-acetyltransferase [Flavisericum labens]|uniref:GNAT family N-acetyltransferase n=1 Tax=Flavisericum labens TaxID=3377112 RepID=UPI00387B6FED
MGTYKVVRYTPDFYNKWNDFLKVTKNATFLFHRDFMDYHSDRFTDSSLMVYKKDKLVAVLPANQKGDTIYSHQGLSYGGVVLKSDLKFKDVLYVFYELLKHLSQQGKDVFELKLLPQMYSNIPIQEINYILFILDALVVKKEVLSVIDRKSPLQISKNRLEGVKRGAKNELKIVEENTFEGFWNEVLIPNLSKKHNVSPVHSLAEISDLKRKFPENIKQFNVYHNQKLVAGTTMFLTENVAHCQYISGNSDKNTLGSLDFLFEHLIKNIFENKLYFDFGSSNEDNGKKINTGLQFWKEGFGARSIVQEFYSVEVGNYKKLKSVII